MKLSLKSTQMLVGLLCIFVFYEVAKPYQSSNENLTQYEKLYDQLMHLEPDFNQSESLNQEFNFLLSFLLSFQQEEIQPHVFRNRSL